MASGEGYELCKSVCQQPYHAEAAAAALAALYGAPIQRGMALVLGHTYSCEPCRSALKAVGITDIVHWGLDVTYDRRKSAFAMWVEKLLRWLRLA